MGMWLSSKRMPLNQSKVFPREEPRRRWLLRAQQELSGSGGFDPIPPAKLVSLESEWLEGFSLLRTFSPWSGAEERICVSLQRGDGCRHQRHPSRGGSSPSSLHLTTLDCP